MRPVAAFAVIAALAGCSEAAPTRIDGSSPEAFARTTEAARRYADHDPEAKARIAFDGMTAADVVATERERAP
jgi:hypothetical protein